MKKLGLIKKCSITLVIAVLCLAIMFTCFAFSVPFGGVFSAEEGDETTTPSVTTDSKGVAIAGALKLKDSVNYGEDIAVPCPEGSKVTVTAPNGDKTESASATTVTANQLGSYKLTYTNADNGNVSYDFYVNVRMDEEYFLKVDYNGADIPSHLEFGKTFTVPDAKVVYYDKDNILRELVDKDGKPLYTLTVSDSRSSTLSYDPKSTDAEKKTFTAAQANVGKAGKVFLTYTAKVVNADGNGTKHFNQTYTVNLQSNVPSEGNPVLSVSGVQKDVSVNRAVTLPKATATDTYDDNVKVVIEVTDPTGEKVTNVDIDANGYAYKKADKKYGEVLFDNDKAMTFYPTEIGTYKVTYEAFSDSYDGTANSQGKSSKREYFITVSDLVAPVFKNVDEYLIPETWGLHVKNTDGGADIDMSGKIKFTVPTVVDNKDHMPENAEDTDDVISVYFRITDSDKSKTIIEFSNILSSTESDYKFTKNSVYDADATFDKENGFVFDFTNYKKDGALTGTYTVLYRARDKANNTSSKTYTVTLQDEYKDVAAPTTAEVTVPDYISENDKTFTVPYADYADASDTRPQVDYRIYVSETVYADVKGGETLEIENGNLVINKDKADEQTLALGEATQIYFYVGVTDKVGNFKSNTEDNSATWNKSKAVKLIKDTATVTDIKYTGKIDFKSVTNVAAAETNYKAGTTVNAGGFAIATTYAMRDFTGFEVAVRDPQGNPLNVTLEAVSVADETANTANIYVQNIKFLPSIGTDDGEAYTLTVRVFDVNGNNIVYGYTLAGVDGPTNSNGTTSAIAAIGSTGNVNVKYKLNNEVIKGIVIEDEDGDDPVFRVVRQISGGVFSLMGSEFTAKTQGKYTVKDGYINQNKLHNGVYVNNYETDVKFSSANDGVYNFTITDESAPVIEMQGTMPVYWNKYNADSENAEDKTPVTLPVVVAYTDNGMAEVDIEVKDPDSRDVVVDKTDKKAMTFRATKDGAYTVTYTATYANATPATATYTINVGDIDAPEFTLSGGTDVQGTYKVGDTFTFSSIVLTEGSASEHDKVSITKRLINPSKEEVSAATVSGSYDNNATKGNNGSDITFTMAGDYEVVYTATDAVGNPYTLRYTITVVSSGSSTPTTWTTLSTVLIIVAVVLLAGVIVYVVRFRKVKK